MPKASPKHSLDEASLSYALDALNLLYPDESMWFATWSKKVQVDFFGVAISIEQAFFRRSVGKSRRSLMILSKQSLGRLYTCLTEANPKFEAVVQQLAANEHRLIELSGRLPPGAN
jgi:hypothetical protein